MVTIPDTVVPEVGAAMETVGGVVSGGSVTCTDAPVAINGISLAFGRDAMGWLTRIGREVFEEPVLSPTFTTATTPSPRGVLFRPQTIHRVEPLVASHVTDFPAAEATGPALALTALKSTGSWLRVN
jgi:hypothetical protein